MAKKPSGLVAEIDPAAEYTVKLKKAFKYGPTWLRPGAERVRLLGSVVLEHEDAVDSFELVTPRA